MLINCNAPTPERFTRLERKRSTDTAGFHMRHDRDRGACPPPLAALRHRFRHGSLGVRKVLKAAGMLGNVGLILGRTMSGKLIRVTELLPRPAGGRNGSR